VIYDVATLKFWQKAGGNRLDLFKELILPKKLVRLNQLLSIFQL